MFGLTSLGAIHTAFALIAMAYALIAYVRYREISPRNRVGQVYIATTFITAVTALGIYERGGFGFQHILAILTLVTIATGTLAALTKTFGRASRYVQVVSYSTSVFMHLLPAVTESLTRLPPGNPIIATAYEPIFKPIWGFMLLTFLVVVTIQMRSLHSRIS